MLVCLLHLYRSALLDEKQRLEAALAAEQEQLKKQQESAANSEGRSAAAAAAAAAVAAAEAEAAAEAGDGVDSLDAFMTDISQQMEQDKVRSGSCASMHSCKQAAGAVQHSYAGCTAGQSLWCYVVLAAACTWGCCHAALYAVPNLSEHAANPTLLQQQQSHTCASAPAC